MTQKFESVILVLNACKGEVLRKQEVLDAVSALRRFSTLAEAHVRLVRANRELRIVNQELQTIHLHTLLYNDEISAAKNLIGELVDMKEES